MSSVPFLIDIEKPWNQQSTQFLPSLGQAGFWFAAVSWSPDGRKLAGYRVTTDGKAFAGVALFDLASRTFELLTESGSIPRWLSDSRRLLFHDRGKICLIDTQSKRVREVVSAAPNQIERRFALSRDDRLICYVIRAIESDVWMAMLK